MKSKAPLTPQEMQLRSARSRWSKFTKKERSEAMKRIRQSGRKTMKTIITFSIALLLLSGSVFADTFRVHYSIRGSGRDVTVQAASSAEARRTVMDIFPGAVVTGVSRIR
jgi:hypothetical protein